MKPSFEAAPEALRHSDETPVWLRRFTKIVAGSTLFLIFAGAMVTSTGSGLAVPDWPLSYGMVMPPMVGGIFYEHGHRMIAATVGLLTVIQAIWLQLREPKRVARILGWCSVAAVIAQGVLGGVTVLLLLPHSVSIAHAALAEIFFCLNTSIAFFTSRWFRASRTMEKGDAPVGLTSSLVLVIYVQILIGATMRHLGAGLAIPDFPMSFGHLVPPFTSLEIAVNFAHRAGGVCVAALVIYTAIRLRRFEASHPLRQLSNLLVTVVLIQVALGGYVVWSGKQPVISSVHVMTGAATLALSLLTALTARTVGWRTGRQGARALLVTEVPA
jgi:cytochrome c oxidase assembly protein subunit 15